jgi:hypothetical protein
MKILNPGKEDYHIHSITFSDGWNSVDEIVKYAGDIGMTRLLSAIILRHYSKPTAY